MRKKKPGRLLLILMVVVAAAVAAWFWWQPRQEAPNFVRYEEFGIDMPVNYSIHGIDVSKFQREINWEAVKQMQVEKIRISFTFIKATEGITRQDAAFKRNWQKAGKAGLVRGAYHFFYSTCDPIKQPINL